MTRLLAAAALVGLLCVPFGASALPGGMPAGHPPMPSASHGAPAAAGLQVEVQRVSPEGPVAPLEGAEVVLERWIQPPPSATSASGGPRLDAAFAQRTDAHGRVRFPDDTQPGTTATWVATVIYRGVSFRADVARSPHGAPPTLLRVYEPTTALDDLSLDVFSGFEVQEAHLIVEQTFTVTNRGPRVVDLEAAARGLRLPLLLPAAFDQALDPGLLPPATSARHMSLRRDPDRGRFSFEGGGVAYRGPIVPGEPLSLQVRFAIPMVHDRLDLALRAPVDLSRLIVSTAFNERVAPRIFPAAPFTVAERAAGGNVQRLMRWKTPPTAGQMALLRIDRLPRGLDVQRGVALAGGLVAVVAFGLLLLVGRRRDG